MQVQKPKQGYKIVKTLFGKYDVPEEWKLEKLGNHSTLFVPMRDKPKQFGGEIDWLRIEDFDGKYVSRSKSNQKVSLDTIKEMRLRVYPIGTVLCSCSATIGAYAITARELITNQTFIGIYPHKDLDKEFLYYYLNTQTKNLIKIGSGTTILYISREKFEDFPIIIPPLNQQRKIASILSNVDSLIEQTQIIIEKTQRLKKGLMQKLLTKGIGHTKFKKIKWFFGKEIKIPEEWEISSLGKFVKIISGEYFEYSEFSELGIRVLKIDNVMYGRIDWENKTFLPEKYLESHKDLVLAEDDIVLALNRPITHNELKVAKLTKNDLPSILYQRVGKIKFMNNDNREFFYVFFNSPIFKKILSRILIGSDQPYVKTTELLKQTIILPKDPAERKIIDTILTDVNNEIQKQQEYKSKLENLKKGLMQKLLTGQIRVKV
jgi:type I restriction enzyme S subunit